MKTTGSDQTVKNICVVYRPQSKITTFIYELEKMFVLLRTLKPETLVFGGFHEGTLKSSTGRKQI